LEDEGTSKDGTDKDRVSFDQGVVDGGVDGLKMSLVWRCFKVCIDLESIYQFMAQCSSSRNTAKSQTTPPFQRSQA
jgi:hypothetical protein